ncbi:MAG: hypothetical protein GX558_04360 [Clostridiales bacterium]|nr:hypothetical protein [Clostridiales bacterium]
MPIDERELAPIAALLRMTMPPQGAEAAAERLIAQYGRAAAVFEADPEELTSPGGLTMRQAQLLCAIPPLAGRCLRERLGPTPILNTLPAASAFVGTLFIGARYEQFYLICLDGAGRLLTLKLVQQGTVGETPFYPRLVVELALRARAHAVIFAHNHPGGTPHFSPGDLDCTRRAARLMSMINVTPLDHLLSAGNEVVSLRRRQFIPEAEWLASSPDRPLCEKWLPRAGEKTPERA